MAFTLHGDPPERRGERRAGGQRARREDRAAPRLPQPRRPPGRRRHGHERHRRAAAGQPRHGQQVAPALRAQGLAGLGDAPRSGAPGSYTAETERRILAQARRAGPRGRDGVDRAAPCESARRRLRGPRLAGLSQARHPPAAAPQLVREHRPRVRRQGGRHRRPLPGAARERARHLRRREAADPGAGAGPGLPALRRRADVHAASATATSATARRPSSAPSRWPPAS